MFEMNHFKSIDELVKFFPTEQSCIDFLERQRWGDHVVSPYDPDSKVYKTYSAIIRKQIPVILFFGKLFLGALKKKERERKMRKTIE